MVKQIFIALKICTRILLVVMIFLLTTTCERDDICPGDVPTTPRLLLEFFDTTSQENNKNVPSFFAQGVGNNEPLSGFAGGSATTEVQLPLRTDDNTTSFRFIRDYEIDDEGNISGNEDIITITYTRENVYVSRACGFKTVFRNVLITLDESDTDRWIDFVQSINDNQSVEDETAIHFKFFH